MAVGSARAAGIGFIVMIAMAIPATAVTPATMRNTFCARLPAVSKKSRSSHALPSEACHALIDSTKASG